MRNPTRLPILGLLLASASIPAIAVRRMSVDQIQQIVLADQSSHRKDAEAARQLADIELTTRIPATQLQQLLAASPGPQTTQILKAITDQSAFLDPPPSELPARPTPDLVAQKAILSQTIHYVARTLPTLPDFLATRKTEHYDDAPRPLAAGEWPSRVPLSFRSTIQAPIAFRDGRETDDPFNSATLQKTSGNSKPPKNKAPATPSVGLTSWGEFGPILGIVLVDAAKGKLAWSHWEQFDGKPAAVFQFAVDRSISHYTVQFWGNGPVEQVGSKTGARGGGFMSAAVDKVEDAKLISQATGYHGHLTVDPETGTILRITIQADLHPEDPIQKADILVEYGPVQIGDTTRTCPVRSVSVSLSHGPYKASPISPVIDIVEQQLNEVAFTNYRRFGSEARLIADVSESEHPTEPNPEATAVASTTESPASAPGPVAEPATTPISQPTANPSPTTASANETASANPPPAVNPAPTATESDEEILIRQVDSLPGITAEADAAANTSAANASNADSGNFTLKVTTRLVDLGLVATDKHGKPLTDLKQDEIEIYDNGRKQQLRAFHHSVPGAPAPTASSSDSGTFTNTIPVQTEDAPDILILLLDESHLAYLDLNRARGEILRFLKTAQPNARMALYAIGEHGFHVLQDVTSDHALVIQKLASWTPSAAAVSQAQALETRNRQQIDEVRNVSDLNSVNGNSNSAPDYITSTDPQLRQLGDNPLAAALGSMISLARHFAPVLGHKSIAWIAGDSVLADWSDQLVGMEKGDKLLEGALQHTKEALNEAHIALYAIDASAVSASGPDASLENQNVMVNPTATNMSAPGAYAPTRNTTAGRQTAEMQQNLHAIQGPVRLLAESTGGRAINKGGDLKATLDTVVQDSTALYELGFDPDTPADNKFHTLQVKIPSRKDVKLRYRTGYLYNEESPSTQQRFQQAIWSPQDSTAIALTAEAIPDDSAKGQSTVKLRIALPGLALEKKDIQPASQTEAQSTDKTARWSDNLYIFLAQRDDATQKAEVSGDTLRLSLKQATYESGMPGGIPYRHSVDAKSKFGSLRILVIDGNSGKIGTVTLPNSALH